MNNNQIEVMMKFFKRLLGICETPLPADSDAWAVQDGNVRINLSRMNELKNPGSGVRLEGKGLDPRLLVFHGDDGQYHAVANRCTHMGRRIDPIAGGSVIQCCSVSKSTFTYDGRPVGGAAQRPLKTYGISQDQETLTIKLDE
ncbi:Rieske [2Fe-2S] iron-sulfur domain protein [Desulfosarcina variabilis str. Montpellier]|uniref:QcrA and Rieske domain-containing protein n=1 Tax=Desulfosarcina variabilis TaxID=2300 RepID=UPI003AFA0D23